MQFKSVWRTGVGVMPVQVSARPALHIGAVIASFFIHRPCSWMIQLFSLF